MTIINRPSVTIEHNNNGGSTYVVRHGESPVEYVRLGWAQDEKSIMKLAKSFTKEFDRLAAEIEEGNVKPYFIMKMMADNGLFRTRTPMAKLKNAI
jgi:hypothetical protein